MQISERCRLTWHEHDQWKMTPPSRPVFSVKPRPNDRNMPTQHVATLLGATCSVRLATVLRHVGCCWLTFDQFQTLSQLHPTCRNTSQHGGQTRATCCAQQCCDRLAGALEKQLEAGVRRTKLSLSLSSSYFC